MSGKTRLHDADLSSRRPASETGCHHQNRLLRWTVGRLNGTPTLAVWDATRRALSNEPRYYLKSCEAGELHTTAARILRPHFVHDRQTAEVTFYKRSLITIWLKEVVISAIIRKILCKWREPLICHIKQLPRARCNPRSPRHSFSRAGAYAFN